MQISARTAVVGGGVVILAAVVAFSTATGSLFGKEKELKVLQLPLRAESPKTIDPVRGFSTYENRMCSMVYDTLLQYKYLERPYELEPLLLTRMPDVSDDGLTYRFELKQGVRFQDDPCFPGGKGRELVARDVFYSWKRMAEDDNAPKSWHLFKGSIVGFDEYREEQNAADEFDYDVAVEGLRIVDDHTFEVRLTVPVYRFLYTLAMFQTAVLPREAVEHYGIRFARHPVGTGPFALADWNDQGMTFVRNPTYREEYFPTETGPADEGLDFADAKGRQLPIVDRVEYTFFAKDQPMWLRFEEGTLAYSQVPAENFGMAFNARTGRLDSRFRRRGIQSQPVQLIDFIFRQFNMEDELLGGYDEKSRALRRAIVLAIDFDEFNSAFYNDQCLVYDGMIPPGLEGSPRTENRRVRPHFRGPKLDLAREYLAQAGYPEGRGLPPIEYYGSSNSTGPEQADMMVRQLGRIGVRLNVRLTDFGTLIDALTKKKAQMFSYAWNGDYPDAENFLALFYGPNATPGSNHSNYSNPEFDTMYERAQGMPPSAERTALYEKMRDTVLEDAAFAGSLCRTRYYVAQPWLRNFKATEMFTNWVKYLDVDGELRQ